MTRSRVVIAGLGDTGVLTAIRLARRFHVVGISSKPGLVSGQELGQRLARPGSWARDYRVDFSSLRGLASVQNVHGLLTGADLRARTVTVRLADGAVEQHPYDVLVISTGVRNGFWRQPHLQSSAEIDDDLRDAHERLAGAGSVLVIGGGAAAVSTAYNAARVWPAKQVDLFFPGERALPLHSRKVWTRLEQRLVTAGVRLHPGHRASIPDGFACDRITAGPVRWTTGQPDTDADAVVWAIGRVRPNTDWLPTDVLDDDGFVRVAPDLRVPGQHGVFAIGDVAATDPLRSSARNFTYNLLAHNVRAHLEGGRPKTFDPPHRRWGSVLGSQPEGTGIFAPDGREFRVPRWAAERVMQDVIVDRIFYRGVRRERRP